MVPGVHVAPLLLCAFSPASSRLAAAARGPAPTLLFHTSFHSCTTRLMPVGVVATVGGGVCGREMCLTM